MKNADRPAAPCKTSENTGEPHYKDVPHNGLTKREVFAAMAMQGLLHTGFPASVYGIDVCEYEQCAIAAVEQADALLKELEK